MAEKPTCAKCETQHWGFTRCEVAPEAASREAELAVQRERLKVIPQPKHDPPQRRKFTSDKYIQVAPGKYVRKER